MDQQFSLFALIFSVLTSFLGSLAFFWYLRGREKRIKSAIAELEYEEQFIDKISRGNVELIRSGFRVLSLALFIVLLSGSMVLSTKLFPFSDVLERIIYMFAVAAWAAAAAGCFSYFKSLARLNNVKLAKEKLAEKRQKLEAKL
ncbi:MAG: hypothetical protein Q7J43_15590 [Pseudomonas sp.]|uniref:hypothetical protein n=1 Tax=Pseudomonas sp. TaxID=306 RepID=UPI002722A551|nr:hypothetical protein [Pseudomonas sp.]MDO9619088.1 hypothetical protein [Pseudomonas sp.]MDP2446646.1 hypothetical protein [Pseudomonas sp.]MDZ4296914.1 hypothetical protein [Moraxellaceae bacterium]